MAGPAADKSGGPPAALQTGEQDRSDGFNRGLKTTEMTFGPVADDAPALRTAPALYWNRTFISLKASVMVTMPPDLKTMASRTTLWTLPSIIAPETKNFLECDSHMDYHANNCCEPYRLVFSGGLSAPTLAALFCA